MPKHKEKAPGKGIHYLLGPIGSNVKSVKSPPKVEGSPRSVSEHEGRVSQPGVPAGPRQTLTPTSPTTVAPTEGPPTPTGPSPAMRAVSRQKTLITKYVTQGYKQKSALSPEEKRLSRVGALGPNERVQKAKREVSNLRNRLLNHPVVKEANAVGKVVPIKGLQKIHQREVEQHGLEGPKGAEQSKRFGLSPRSFLGQPTDLQAKQETSKGMGSAGRLGAQAKATEHQKSEPSTLEDLGYASIGIPGIGIGSDVARVGEAAAKGIPKLLAEGGAKQVAKDFGAGIASKGATAKAGLTALAHTPADALDALKAAPEAVKGLPGVLKAAAKATPEAARGALKATPDVLKGAAKAAPGKTAELGGKTLHNVSGLAALTATQKAGIHTAPGKAAEAFLSGTGSAIEHHPLEVLKTTARSAPSLIVAPASLIESGVESAIEGSPKPLENTASALASGTYGLGKELLSGNSKEVEESIRKKVGVTPFVPLPAIFHHLHESDVYTGAREGLLRKPVENLRSNRRAAQTGKESEMKARELKELKPSVPVKLGSKHSENENYVLRNLGSHLESSKARRIAALDIARSGSYGDIHSKIEENRVVDAFKGRLGFSRLSKKIGPEYEASVSPLAKMGIPHSERGRQLAKQLEDYYGASKEPKVRGAITEREALREANKHPGLFTEGEHAAGTKEFKASAERLAKLTSHSSERARYIAQTDFTNHLLDKMSPKEREAAGLPDRVLKPEERVTAKAEELLGKRPGGGHWSREEAHAQYKALRSEIKRLGESKAKSLGLLDKKQALYKELQNFTHPEHSLDRSTRDRWSPEMVKDYAKEQEAVNSHFGLERPAAYVANRLPKRATPRAGEIERDFSARRTHVNTGKLAASGEASADFTDLMQHSVRRPRERMAQNELIQHSLEESKLPVNIDGTQRHVLNDKELEKAANSGALPANSVAVPTSVVNTVLEGEHSLAAASIPDFLKALQKDPQVAVEGLPKTLREEIASHANDKGQKYIIVGKPTIDELRKQLGSSERSRLRQIANIPTRLILNDPAWVFAQVFAKGIPIGATLGPDALIHGGPAIKAMMDIQKMDPESQARIISMVGSSAGVRGTPSPATAHDPYSDARAIRGSSAGKKVWNLANGNVMGKWDRFNAAKMREFAAAVRSSKGFRNWYGGVRGLDKAMRDIVEKTKGMTAAERLDYIGKHPEMARAVQQHLNKIGGNWNSFTAMERKVAPFAIFYPWIRYSLDWTFHTFPVNHPVAATALAFLAQRNANELQALAAHAERLAGNKNASASNPLSDWTAYAEPVTRNAQNEPETNPSGQRYEPGWGVIPQTAITGEPAKAIGGLNPIIAAAISASTKRDLFTGGELSGGFFKNFGEQTVGELSPWGRFAKTATGFRGIGADPQSSTSRAYEILEGGKGTKTARSVLFPYLKVPAEKTALRNALNSVEERIFKTGNAAQSKVEFNLGQATGKNKAEAEKLKAANSKAWAEKEKLFKLIDPTGKHGLVKQSQVEYAHYKASLPSLFGAESNNPYNIEKGNSAANIYGSGKSETADSIYGVSSAGKGLPAYKPPSEGIHLPNISVPGVGSITGAIGNLIAGTPAQAAELNKSSKKATKVPRIEGFEHKDQQEFAQWFSHYSKIPPKLAGEWVKQEGGGYSNGGEAGKNNWLGVGYPGSPTPFSQSPHFNGSPKKAAKATALWLEGKLGQKYGYVAAPSIQGIAKLAKAGAPESQIRSYIEGPSAWGTGAIDTAGTISVNGKTTAQPSKQTIRVQHLTKAVMRNPIVRQGKTGTISHAGGKVVVTDTSDGPANVKKNKEPQITARLLLLSKKVGKPVYVISGARTPQHSEEVGGFPDDPHTKGEAQDIGVGAPTLASAAAIPESVYESVGLYRPFGTAHGGSSAEDNHVQLLESAPSSVTVGSGSAVGIPAAASSSGTTLPSVLASASESKAPSAKKRSKETSAQKLKLLNEISEGNLTRFGIPESETPSASTLAALGKSLEEQRRKLRAA